MSIVVIANGFVDVAHFLVQRRRRWNTLCFAFACANKGKKQESGANGGKKQKARSNKGKKQSGANGGKKQRE